MTNEVDTQDTFVEMWSQLTPTQRRFVVARQDHPTKKDAAEAIGIAASTTYNWPSIVDEAVRYVENNVALATLGIIQANATKAAMVKAAGLDSTNESIAQSAASEILDRNLGRPTQRTDITSGGEPLPTIQYITENRSDD